MLRRSLQRHTHTHTRSDGNGNGVALGIISSDSLGTIFLPTHGPPITSMPPKRLHPGSEVEPEVIAEQTGDGEATVNEVEQPVKRRRGRPRKTDVSFPSSSFFPPINNIHF